MRPVLFSFGGVTVWSYPAMLYMGLLVGVFAGNLAAHASGMDPAGVYLATLILIVPALAGARLLYVFAKWPLYRKNLRRIWDRKDSGYIMYGGLPAALLVSRPLLGWLHLSIPGYWDVAIFTILVGMVFTRVGCLLNGCCAGRRSSSRFAITLPNENGVWEKRIPTQALESGWAAVLLLLAVRFRPLTPFPGALFLLVSLGYALGRILMEFGRERKTQAGCTIAHMISLLITLLSVTILTVYWRR